MWQRLKKPDKISVRPPGGHRVSECMVFFQVVIKGERLRSVVTKVNKKAMLKKGDKREKRGHLPNQVFFPLNAVFFLLTDK